MSGSLQMVRDLFDYHHRARQQTLETVSRLSAEEFLRDQGVGWRSIRNTILHGLFAEAYWIEHVLSGDPRPSWSPESVPDVPSLARLAEQVRERSQKWLAAVTEKQLGEEQTWTFSSGATIKFTIAKVLLHVVIHESHHRGQVMALVRQMGYEPPEVDLLG